MGRHLPLPVVLTPLLCRVKTIGSHQRILIAVAALSGLAAVILSVARGSWIALLAVIPLMLVFGWFRLSGYEKKPYLISIASSVFLALFAVEPICRKDLRPV